MGLPQTNHREKDKSYFTVSVAIVIHTVVVFILLIYKWFWYPNAFRGYAYNFLAHLLQEFASFFFFVERLFKYFILYVWMHEYTCIKYVCICFVCLANKCTRSTTVNIHWNHLPAATASFVGHQLLPQSPHNTLCRTHSTRKYLLLSFYKCSRNNAGRPLESKMSSLAV